MSLKEKLNDLKDALVLNREKAEAVADDDSLSDMVDAVKDAVADAADAIADAATGDENDALVLDKDVAEAKAKE